MIITIYRDLTIFDLLLLSQSDSMMIMESMESHPACNESIVIITRSCTVVIIVKEYCVRAPATSKTSSLQRSPTYLYFWVFICEFTSNIVTHGTY